MRVIHDRKTARQQGGTPISKPTTPADYGGELPRIREVRYTFPSAHPRTAPPPVGDCHSRALESALACVRSCRSRQLMPIHLHHVFIVR